MSSRKEDFNKNQIGDYILNEELGFGGFAKVVEGIHIPTGEKVAIKILDKNKLYSDSLALKRIKLEISILKNTRHKNIIKLYEVMETPQKIYLIMEYCKGGELFNYIIRKKHLSEEQSCKFFHEIIDALEYLHVQNIVHRDIKPQNILLDNLNNEITIKIIDFGISNIYSLDNLLETSCGTASYAPPEMHTGNKYFGLLTDIWSAGVVLYIMNFGYLPFCEEDEDKNIQNIINGNYEIPKEANPELKDFLKHLLDINPLTRYDFDQIKKHPWFNIISSDDSRPGIIIGYNKIPVDENIINMCYEFGYDKNLVRQSVENNHYDSNSSIYYILLQKLKNKGIESISDLYSEKYLQFINDPNNLLINISNKNEKEENKKNNEVGISKNEKKGEKCEKSFELSNVKNKEKNRKINHKEINKDNKKLLIKNSNKIKNNKEKINIKNDNNIKKNNSIINENEKKKNNEIKNNLNNNDRLKISIKKIYNIKKNQIINKINHVNSIENRLKPINSYKKIYLNNINTFKDYKIEEKLNNSFREKLSDNLEEKILKLLNPKKREKNKSKVKEELINLKLKIKSGKSFNEKQKESKNKKNKISLSKKNKNNLSKNKYDSIFKNEKEKHTLIHNRNASAENGKRRANKKNKISKEKNIKKNYNRKLSLSPINTNKNISSINKVNIPKLDYYQNNNYNSNLVTKRNHNNSDLSDDFEFLSSNYEYNSNYSNNIKVSKNKEKIKKKQIPQLLRIKKIETNDYAKKNNLKPKYIKDKSTELKSSKKKNKHKNSILNNYESEDNTQRDYNTSRKSELIYNSFCKADKINKRANLVYNSFSQTNKPIKKTIRINFKSIKENNNSNLMVYNNNSNKFKNKLMLMTFDSSKIHKERKNCSLQSRKEFKNLKYVLSSNKKKFASKNINFNNSLIKKDSNIKSNLMPKIKSMRNSTISNKIRKEDETPKKKLMNITSFQHRNSKNMDNSIQPKEYNGPIDIKNLIVSNSIKTISDEIYSILKKNKIKQCRLNPYQFFCNKNGEIFEINIYYISGINQHNSNQLEDIIEINNYYVDYDTAIKNCFYDKKNLYYYTIFNKKDKNNNYVNNKLNSEIIHKIINKKFSIKQS